MKVSDPNEINKNREINRADEEFNRPDDEISRAEGEILSEDDEISRTFETKGESKLKGKWEQYVGAAKTAWGKLTRDELLESEGEEQRLTALIQERYGIDREAARQQVRNFIDKYKY